VATSILKKALVVMSVAALGGMAGFGALAQEAKPKTEKKVVTKAPSACKGLEQSVCKGKSECRWVSESKDKATGAVKRKAYCGAKPAPKAKTDAK